MASLANARMSRQPMAIYESILFRKEMRTMVLSKSLLNNGLEELILLLTQLHIKAQ
jgi:hypothetical protein